MIYAFTGKTGSGKTYRMVHYAYRQWLRGRDIYTNTPLLFADYPRRKRGYTPGKIVLFEHITEILEATDALILFDEAQVLFNARLWDSLPPEFQYKLQQHRKHKLDLYCTTQNMGTIDITYRRLVQHWYHYEDRFAFLWKRNPSIFTVHCEMEKDIDELYNTVDDLKVPNLSTKYFFIHRLKRRLYDTYYDIGFKRFKTLWITQMKASKREISSTSQWMIVPKQMSLSDARRAISSLKSASRQPNFRR